MKWLLIALGLAACSPYPGPPPGIWYSTDPELVQIIADASELLCDSSNGEVCPLWTDEPHGTREVDRRDIEDCELAGLSRLWVTLATNRCAAQVPDGIGRWRDATDHEIDVIMLAHGMGHSMWGPEHDERLGALMQPRAVKYYVPLLLPDGE